MNITSQQAAPLFTIQDITGATINLADYKGKKILLAFNRNVGCPICNIRFHQLQKETDFFKSKGLVVLGVYESSAEKMKDFLEGTIVYAKMIPNPDLSLYKLYAVERSIAKLIKGFFLGAIGKGWAGNALYKKRIKQDGTRDRIGAEFLIDEQGIVQTAYYGKFLGDDLPIADIKKFLN
jgi:thioredoxin-dependent peroxiredoxin